MNKINITRFGDVRVPVNSASQVFRNWSKVQLGQVAYTYGINTDNNTQYMVIPATDSTNASVVQGLISSGVKPDKIQTHSNFFREMNYKINYVQ